MSAVASIGTNSCIQKGQLKGSLAPLTPRLIFVRAFFSIDSAFRSVI